MRTALISTFLASLVALAGASGCGGNVVVDGEPTGSGGTGAVGTSGAGTGATAPGPSPMESCHAFCALFDPACPDNACRAQCASLLSGPRECSAQAGEYFECMTGIYIPDDTPCAWVSDWLEPLFACMDTAIPCRTDFAAPCIEVFEEYKTCQRE
ncbi:hypothetical protein WMF31_31745 [Sorangium sp. So ce1036]|uniref:hypothetical protein n=1 Tax=Sorangium sp. So ce1036 TaxID=3133328 RepID=UPI003F0DD7E3